MRWIALICLTVLAACVSTVEPAQTRRPAQQPATSAPPPDTPSRAQVQQFVTVVRRVEPMAERECARRAPQLNCDFNIVVDDRPGRPPNAYQTVDQAGRPVLAFNLALIAGVRNADELAFVMGHEAAHHIAGHIPRQRQSAAAGAILLGGLAAITGAGSDTVDQLADVGASVGARTFSKDYELEADALGTVISKRSGYDPLRGAEFFARIPDPGNRFLGTHPPNAQRIEVVRRTAAGL